MIIVKFGGSVITDKGKECTFAPERTGKLVKELAKFCNNKNHDLILVHGAGSFGHIKAKKYELNNGYKNDEQYIGISQVHRDVRKLNLQFMDLLLDNSMPGLTIPPVVNIQNSDKEISEMDTDIFRNVLDLNLIPISYGDVVLDDKLRFSICSGDLIIRWLAEIFQPERVIFLTDVDGLFSNHPTLDPNNAKLITELSHETFSSAVTDQQINPDVTGGIYLKGKIALYLTKLGIDVYIINGEHPSRFKSALAGDDVFGTAAKKQ